MEQKKIDELKKLTEFGVLLINKLNENKDFYLLISMMTDAGRDNLLANYVCAFDYDYTVNNTLLDFNPKIIEKAYSEFIKFKNRSKEKHYDKTL